MAADPIWASVNTDGTFVSPKVQAAIDARAKAQVGEAMASSYVIVGPGRPDVPSTTAGTITGAEPVGAEYRSQDGAQVGANVWMNRPGGKWEVTDGDTGWRLYGTITGGTDGVCEVRVRRINGRTLWHLVFTAGTFPAGSYHLVGTYPPGFEPSTWRHDNAEYGVPIMANIGNGQAVQLGVAAVLTHSANQAIPMFKVDNSMSRRTGALIELPTDATWPLAPYNTPA